MARVSLTNVSMSEIRDVLNAAGGNVTNVLGTFFTSDAKINKWSKCKPIDHSNQVSVSFDSDPTRAKGQIWGLTPCKTDIWLGAIAKAAWEISPAFGSTYGDWRYNMPKGGSSSPYRLADFRNYNPAARQVFDGGVTGHQILQEANVITVNTYENNRKLTFYITSNGFGDFGSLNNFFQNGQLRMVLEVYFDKPAIPWTSLTTPSVRIIDTKSIASVTNYDISMSVDVIDDLKLNVSSNTKAVVAWGLQDCGSDGTSKGVIYVPPINNAMMLPFVRMVKVVSIQKRRFKFDQYKFMTVGTWYNGSSTLSETYKGTPVVVCQLQMEKDSSPVTLPSTWKVRAKLIGSFEDGTTEREDLGTPSDANGQTLTSVTISTGSTGSYQTFYWRFPNLVTYGYANTILVQTSADSGSTWQNVTEMNMRSANKGYIQFVS